MADSEPVATQEESENKEPEKTKEDLLKENESLKAQVEGLKQNVKDRKRKSFKVSNFRTKLCFFNVAFRTKKN